MIGKIPGLLRRAVLVLFLTVAYSGLAMQAQHAAEFQI